MRRRTSAICRTTHPRTPQGHMHQTKNTANSATVQVPEARLPHTQRGNSGNCDGPPSSQSINHTPGSGGRHGDGMGKSPPGAAAGLAPRHCERRHPQPRQRWGCCPRRSPSPHCLVPRHVQPAAGSLAQGRHQRGLGRTVQPCSPGGPQRSRWGRPLVGPLQRFAAGARTRTQWGC